MQLKDDETVRNSIKIAGAVPAVPHLYPMLNPMASSAVESPNYPLFLFLSLSFSVVIPG